MGGYELLFVLLCGLALAAIIMWPRRKPCD